MTTFADLARTPFVSLTTYRRDGTPVPTPVWVVGQGDDLLVWTGGSSGKVKRIRRDPTVDLAPCSRRGAVDDDAPHLAGRASVTADTAVLDRVGAALARKYGLQYRAITLIEGVVRRVKRRPDDRVVVRITPA